MTDLAEEIRHFSNEMETRAFANKPLKAAYILMNYCGEMEITKTGIASFFNISRSQIELACWKLLCGWETNDLTTPRYLPPCLEDKLSLWIEDCRASHNSVGKEAIIEKVRFIYLTFRLSA
jgi:hypothetical protein